MAMTMPPQTTAAHPPRSRRPYRALTAILSGLVFGALVYKALVTLPAVYPGRWDLVVAAIAGIVYAAVPMLGGIVAVLALVAPVALKSLGFVGVFGVVAILLGICLMKREAVILLSVVALALIHPGLAALLPLIPVLAGLIYGRFVGAYVAGAFALALIVWGVIGGKEFFSILYVGGHRNPFMDTELMTSLPPALPDFLQESFAQAVIEQSGEFWLFTLYLAGQHWMTGALLGSVLVFAELGPRLLDASLLAQLAVWTITASATAWLAGSTSKAYRRVAVVWGGTGIVIIGHWLVFRTIDATLLSFADFLKAWGIAGGIATFFALILGSGPTKQRSFGVRTAETPGDGSEPSTAPAIGVGSTR